MDTRPIGVFDSGIGGVTVFKEIRKLLPNENIIYYADTARVPYGPRPTEEIIRFSLDAVDFLLKQQIKLLVIACNTVSAVAFDAILAHTDIPVIGVIEPGTRSVVSRSGIHKLGLIATEATVRSGEYQKRLTEEEPNLQLITKACPMLVSLIEEGWGNTEISKLVIQKYMEDMKGADLDGLILACTHFPVIRAQIEEYLGPDVQIIDPAEETAKELERVLQERKLLHPAETEASIRFYVSDKPEKFKSIVEKILDPRDIRQVSLT